MLSKLTGTGVALITPFKEDNTVDFDGLKRLLNHVIQGGVNYLVVNGTTAESVTTTQEERWEILSLILQESKGLPIVYGIGGNNTSDIVRRIEKADLKGIHAILSVSPYYNKPSQEGIYQHYKAIAEASPVPILLYNVPGRTGSNIQAKTTIRLSELPNIIGIKEASGDLLQTLEIIKYSKKDFLVISGDDMLTVPMISIGAQGVISVLANAFPQKFSEMVDLALKNQFNKAAENLKEFVEINPLMYEEGNPVGIKQVLELKGICPSNVRLPLVKCSEGLARRIQNAVEAMK
ncbi:MAG TPA: 4-hydroxy-tetrahydrodipicolinate synthase [Cytophagaceae bacterium]